MATENLPFVALGSGQGTADPFLAFLRRVFWPDALPTIAEGVFAVTWTLHHAIETTPGGIADPKQVAVLKKIDDNWKAEILDDAKLDEHRQHINEAETYLRDFSGSGRVEAPPERPDPDTAG
ncbi:MAG: hypothetical protein ACREX3_04935 [Gammaproteobacteria bacterium]